MIPGSRVSLFAVFTFGVVLAGCRDLATEPRTGLRGDEAESLALFLTQEDVLGTVLGAEVGTVRTGTSSFSRSAPCPAGGTRTFTGSSTYSQDPETRIVSTEWSNIQAHEQCAFSARRGDESVLRVIDGRVTVEGSGQYRLPEERGAGRTIIAYTSSRTGTLTTTVNGRSTTCRIDLVQTYDPETGTFHLSGVVCGRDVETTHRSG